MEKRFFIDNFDAARDGSVEIAGVSVKTAQLGETGKNLGRKLSVLDFHSLKFD